jgi:hypothetical protein
MMLLNTLESRSQTQAPEEHSPPVHSAKELFEILRARMDAGLAIEPIAGQRLRRADDGTITDDLVQLCDLRIEQHDDKSFAVLLVQYVNADQRTFPVVNRKTLKGRELEGEADERGARAAHILVALPANGVLDDGRYRCVLEHVDGIRRRDVELLFRRQLRAYAKENEFQFTVKIPGKRKERTKAYKYYPRFTLSADVGRAVKGGGLLLENLTQLVFTKRAEKQMTGGETSVIHHDVMGDVEVRIPASQAPDDANEKLAWLQDVQTRFRERGYSARLYYRHGKAGQLSGTLDKAVEGAMDLLMCPKQIVEVTTEPKPWRSHTDTETVERMIELLQNDELWEKLK